MTETNQTRTKPQTRSSDASVGELVSQITTDVSVLVRQELALAKAELKDEATQAGKGAGMLGAAGFAGGLLVVFAALAAMFGLDHVMPLWLAAVVVAAVLGLAALLLYRRGRAELKKVDPTPHQTIETLKEPLR